MKVNWLQPSFRTGLFLLGATVIVFIFTNLAAFYGGDTLTNFLTSILVVNIILLIGYTFLGKGHPVFRCAVLVCIAIYLIYMGYIIWTFFYGNIQD